MSTLRLLVVVVFIAACAGPTTTAQPTAPSTADASPAPTAAPSAAPTETPTTAPTPASSPTSGPTSTPAATPAATPEPTTAPPTDVEISVELFADLDAPLILFTNDGAGNHYAVGQDGGIFVVGLDGAAQADPFLDISDRIVSGGEQGLLGLAFHPEYESNGRFFVNYTNDDGDTVVAEFARADSADGVLADAESERIVLTIQQPFPNHNGGMIAFGPDGYLYIGMGDGGSGGDPMGNGQALGTMLGKMLRIDVNSGDPYGIPPDNPFVGANGLPEIWSLGWRNPWRFSFDLRGSGAMFVGDVGQGAVEEIDAEPAGTGGRNYGWNTMEGDECFRTDPCNTDGLTLPVVSNHRERGECAIIGGYVYRGSEFPELTGLYIYSDICSGDLWAFDAETALASGVADPVIVGSAPGSASFGEDINGELYVVNLDGEIYKLVGERIRP